jgi:hypothetical protein
MATFLMRADTLDTHEELGIVDVVAAVCEGLECHEAGKSTAVFAVEGALELCAVVAILVHHEIAVSLAFGEDAGE